MSDQTKQQLRADRDALLTSLNSVTEENENARMEIEELVLKLDESQANLGHCENALESTRKELSEVQMAVPIFRSNLAHVMRQRDTLIGYIEGMRLDREQPNMMVPDRMGEPQTRTRTDQFLDEMRLEPGVVGAPGDKPRRPWEFP
jgi:chromosome segregation ATPase